MKLKNISDTDKHKRTNKRLSQQSFPLLTRLKNKKEKNLNDKFDVVFQKMKDMTTDEKQYWIFNSHNKVVMKNGILYLLNKDGTKKDVFPYLNKIQSNNFNQFKNNYIKYIN